MNLVSWEVCNKIWKECPGCGCFGQMTWQGWLLLLGLPLFLAILVRIWYSYHRCDEVICTTTFYPEGNVCSKTWEKKK